MKRITLQDFDQYLKNYGDENEYPPLDSRFVQWVKHFFPQKNAKVSFDYMDEMFKSFYVDRDTIVRALVDNHSVLEPHFHLIGWHDFHVTISLIRPSLFDHGFENSTLIEEQRVNIISWLGDWFSPASETHWSGLAGNWNFNSWTYYRCDEYRMPNYTLLERM